VQPEHSTSTPAGCPTVDELARFVDKQANPSLTAHVLSHLDVCHECRVLLVATLRTWQQPTDPSTVPCVPRTFPVGEVVGERYRIDRLISRGGMGEVYQAWDLQLQESIAIKTIACHVLDDASLYVRFRKEVQLARKVTHPNVCRILEFGLHRQLYRGQEETIPFFTMEFLDGETLASYLARNGPLPLALFLQIASHILRGMSAIHAEGIVHRDLKPENIFLLGQPTGDFRVVVMDFGLARLQDNRGSPSESSVGSAVGTPTYMAPEQCLGGIPNVKWDIFALGVVFFRAISGQLPFKGNTTTALAMARIQVPAPLLSSIVPDVDPHIEAVIARCLERNPASRFANVDEIQRTLGEVHARTASRYRLRKRPIAAWLLSAIIITIVTSLSMLRPRTAQPSRSRGSTRSSLTTRSERAEGRSPVVAEAKPPSQAIPVAQAPLGASAGQVSVLSPTVATARRKPSIGAAGAPPSRHVPTAAELPAAATEPEFASRTSTLLDQPAAASARALGENDVVVPGFVKAARRNPDGAP